MRKTRKMHRNKRRTRNRRGGVGEQTERATALQQALMRLTNNPNAAHQDVLRNILAQEPRRDRLRAITKMEEDQDQHLRNLALQEVLKQRTNQPDYDLASYIFSLESPRGREQARARMAANTAAAAIQADDRVRIATLENLLGRTQFAEPDLVRQLQRQSLAGPSQPQLRDIRESGAARRNRIQEMFDHRDWIQARNREYLRQAYLRNYPTIDLNNIPVGLPIPPARQMAHYSLPFDDLP